jgi:hypothetical protein
VQEYGVITGRREWPTEQRRRAFLDASTEALGIPHRFKPMP